MTSNQNSEPRTLHGIELPAMIAVLLLGFAGPIGMAFNIGVVVEQFDIQKTQAGLIATIELSAVAFASFFASRLIGRVSGSMLLLAGLGLIAGANAATMFADKFEVLCAMRMFSGFGTGTVTATVMATAARVANPEMTFGWINAAVGAFIIPISLLLPLVIGAGGFFALYGTYVTCALFAMLFIAFVPAPPVPVATPTVDEQNTSESSAPAGASGNKVNPVSWLGWLALFGAGIVFFAHGGLMVFVERIGDGLALPRATIGYVMAIGGIVAIAGPLTAGFLGARFGYRLPIALILVLLVILTPLLTIASSTSNFYLALPLYMALPVTFMPIFLGALVKLDASGRLASSHPAFVTLGGALGPLVSGVAADFGGFTLVGWGVMTLLVIGGLMMLSGAMSADKTIVPAAAV